MWRLYLASSVLGYLLGSFPTGYLVGRAYGIDIREHGSKNIGATNVVRVLGKKPGYLVFVCDALKGLLAVMIAIFFAAYLAAFRLKNMLSSAEISNQQSFAYSVSNLNGLITLCGIKASLASTVACHCTICSSA